MERLAIVARRTLRGVGQGQRRSKRHGGAVEFSDYRRYAPGDDTRRIDWHAYARLEQMFLKLYVEEQDLSVHVLLDQSASMGTGEPAKLPFARQLAIALAYLALAAGDRVSVRVLRDGKGERAWGPLRGRKSLARLLRSMRSDSAAEGRTDLAGAVQAFEARRPARGVVIVVSDLLDPTGYQAPLKRLRYAGHEVHLIHVLAPDEERPEVGQDYDLEDAETGEVVTCALDRAGVQRYRAAFQAFLAEASAFCRRHELGYATARSDQSFEELIFGALRRSALLR